MGKTMNSMSGCILLPLLLTYATSTTYCLLLLLLTTRQAGPVQQVLRAWLRSVEHQEKASKRGEERKLRRFRAKGEDLKDEGGGKKKKKNKRNPSLENQQHGGEGSEL